MFGCAFLCSSCVTIKPAYLLIIGISNASALIDLDLYENYKAKTWSNVLLFEFLFLMILIFIGLAPKYLEIELPKSSGLLFIVLLVLMLLAKYIKFPTFGNSKNNKGKLRIGKSHISWNDRSIYWKSIVDFAIDYHHLENSRPDLYRIKIRTNVGKEFEGCYALRNNDNLVTLKQALWDCVLANNLRYSIAKEIVKPGSYQQHQELKEKLKENEPVAIVPDFELDGIIKREFPRSVNTVREKLNELLMTTDSIDKNRVGLAVLKLAKSDLRKMESLIERAIADYKDVIAEAENPRTFKLGNRSSDEKYRADVLNDWLEYTEWKNR